MEDKIYFSTYTIKIQNVRGDLQLIDKFNGTDDYFNVLEKFLKKIFKTPIKEKDEKSQKISYHLTLTEPHKSEVSHANPDINFRGCKILYGTFSSGVGGRTYTYKDTEENYKNVFKTDPKKHASFKDLFFLFYFIPTSKELYLVLQKESNFGIKGVLHKVLNRNLQEEGYTLSRLYLYNTIHGSVFKKMIEFGSLKKIEFVKKQIPSTSEGLHKKNGNFEVEKGILKTTLMSYNGLSNDWKNFIHSLRNSHKKINHKHRIDIEVFDEKYDEVEFELELNGKKKTFYIGDSRQVQPDVDVTVDVIDKDRIVKIDKMVTKAKELVIELIAINTNA